MGVWIETKVTEKVQNNTVVTPFVGVWIETFIGDAANRGLAGHTLRGCVD